MIEVLVPHEQEGTKAVVRAWLKNVGDMVAINDPLVELETDKVAVEVPAPVAGILREIVLQGNAEALPGAVLGWIGEAAEGAGEAVHPDSKPEALVQALELKPSPSPVIGEELRLSPSVKRAVRETGLDPRSLAGSGRGGRLTRADIDRAVADGASQPGRSDVVPHDRMRLRIAENMLASVTAAPHVTAVFEADFSAIIAHREANKAAYAADGVKLTYTAYLLKAAAEAMKVAPAINSQWHDDRVEIFHDVNIGVGTALGEKGLVVPVVQRVQMLSLCDVARSLDDLIRRAREEELTTADVRGGTFTISNHGVSGSLFAAPVIINRPQSAILGVGKLEKRVVVREVAGADAIQIRPMAYVSLTIDHRVVDGHQTNAWLSRFVDILDSWPLD